MLSTAPAPERAEAMLLHTAFRNAALMLQQGSKVGETVTKLHSSLQGQPIKVGDEIVRILTPSRKTVENKFSKWRKNGESADCLVRAYKPGRQKAPAALVSEFHRRATLPTGGRNKHGGADNMAEVYRWLSRDWCLGESIPGLGTWQEWWEQTHGLPLPSAPPELPYSYSTLSRKKLHPAVVAMGQRGTIAAKGLLPFVDRDYTKLKPAELYTLDDVRLDIQAIDDRTGKASEVIGYFMMDVASRFIVSFILKPVGAIRQEDVSEVISHGLRTGGILANGTTHLLLERGTVAMAESAATILEAASDGAIKVHRTEMLGGKTRVPGMGRDGSKGNPAGKSVIETFNKVLHIKLGNLPGQRGNNRENQPENLGLVKQGKKGKQGSAIALAEQLSTIERHTGSKLASSPLLRFSELFAAVSEVIDHLNKTPGRNLTGHQTHWEVETAPGVWKNESTLTA